MNSQYPSWLPFFLLNALTAFEKDRTSSLVLPCFKLYIHASAGFVAECPSAELIKGIKSSVLCD